MKFKHEKDHMLFFTIALELQILAYDMALYARDHLGVPFVITSTRSSIETDKAIGRVSSSHREGRALDLSIRGWDSTAIKDFVNHFNKKHEDIAAISGKTLKPVLCVYGDERHIDHIHIQVHKKFATPYK
jgi:hypothetical protein